MHEQLTRYAAGPAELRALVTSLGPGELDLASAPEAWTVREFVHHIVDGDDIWRIALKAALGGEGLTFNQSWYDNHNAWAGTLDYANRPIEQTLAYFQAGREHVTELMGHLPDSWDRAIHFRFDDDDAGQMVTAGQIVAMQARHTTSHLDEIRAILTRHRADPTHE